MQIVGNMRIDKILELDMIKVVCHCEHGFRAKAVIENGKPVLRSDGAISTPSGGKITCPSCGCVWRKTKAELPDFGGWQFYAVYGKMLDDDNKEHTFGVGYAIDHTHFIAEVLLPMLSKIRQNLLIEYRVVLIDEEQFNDILDTAAMQRSSGMFVLLSRLFGDD